MQEAPISSTDYHRVDIAGHPLQELDIHDLPSDRSTRVDYISDEGSFTERTSLSVDRWSPDDNHHWIPLSFRDEYGIDGKTYDFRPDRGDDAVKAETMTDGDDSIRSSICLDHDHLHRSRRIPEVIGPGAPRTPRVRRVLQPRIERVHSDSTDESIPAYPLFPSRGFNS